MSKWIEQRATFYKVAIARGMTNPEEIREAFPLGSSLPPGKMEKWLERFVRMPKEFSSLRRYVNRFKLGADPEFVFTNPTSADLRKDASGLKLKQGPAFGADNNGRLAEIRPHPSRSALEVVASVLATLRWLAVLYPQTMAFDWRAGAWAIEDGLGGHVHFGRKRPGRSKEIVALDAIEETMLDAGFFDSTQQAQRRGGDSHRQLYGQVGDHRLQTHGYEYRTFPSWLDSPELAFLTITLAKLAVHNPEMIWQYQKETGIAPMRRLANLLRFYKDSDDDARLALLLVGRDFPRGGDFKGRWGISVLGKEEVRQSLPAYVPMSIKPTTLEVEEMFNYFFKRIPLTMKIPVPTWEPISPPKGYHMLIDNCSTIQRKGIGELCWDMCTWMDYPFTLYRDGVNRMSENFPISVSHDLTKFLPKHEFAEHHGDRNIIYVLPSALDNGGSLRLRRMLLSGALPIWKVSDVRSESFKQWDKYVRKAPAKDRYVGVWLKEDGPLPGIRY